MRTKLWDGTTLVPLGLMGKIIIINVTEELCASHTSTVLDSSLKISYFLLVLLIYQFHSCCFTKLLSKHEVFIELSGRWTNSIECIELSNFRYYMAASSPTKQLNSFHGTAGF